MRVKDIMTCGVSLVSPALTVQEAAKIMRDANVGSLPVGEDGQLTGMVTDRDIACRAAAEGWDPAKTKIRDITSKKIAHCFDDQDVKDAAHLMEKKQIHRLPVLNREKRMVGILSVGDLAIHASNRLTGEVVEAVSRHAT